MNQSVTILGDGAFGTAFATLLAQNNHHVTLWCYNQNVANDIQKNHINSKYLPNVPLSTNIVPTLYLEKALQNDLIFEAIPVPFMRSVLEQCKPFHKKSHRWVVLSKGIEQKSLLLPTEIVKNVINDNLSVAAISGPSYAHELAQQQPTGVTIAAHDTNFCDDLIQLLKNNCFIIEASDDIIGVQIIGALKNCIALGVGFLDGAGYGSNTQTLLMMRAFEEIKKVLHVYNCPEKTIYGLAGIGDVVLTCFGKESRNYMFGKLRGQGLRFEQVVAQLGRAPEGVNTMESVQEIMEKNNLTLPLLKGLHEIIFHDADVKKLLYLLCQ